MAVESPSLNKSLGKHSRDVRNNFRLTFDFIRPTQLRRATPPLHTIRTLLLNTLPFIDLFLADANQIIKDDLSEFFKTLENHTNQIIESWSNLSTAEKIINERDACGTGNVTCSQIAGIISKISISHIAKLNNIKKEIENKKRETIKTEYSVVTYEVDSRKEGFERLLNQAIGDNSDIFRLDCVIKLIREYSSLLIAELPENKELFKFLWESADFIIIEDFYLLTPENRITDALSSFKNNKYSLKFKMLLELLVSEPSGSIENAYPEFFDANDFKIIYKCFLTHNIPFYREIARKKLEIIDMWTSVSHPSAPLKIIYEILLLFLARKASPNIIKIFFECVKIRLLNYDITELEYLIKLLEIFIKQEFFLQDVYFNELLKIIDTTGKKRSIIKDILDNAINKFKEIKNDIGPIKSYAPPISTMKEVPLFIQKLLAKDGKYVRVFVKHPRAKIAQETVRHIKKVELAVYCASDWNTNSVVLAQIGRKLNLFQKREHQLLLVNNPRTPTNVSKIYFTSFSIGNLEQVMNNRDLPNNTRQAAKNLLLARKRRK